MYSEERITRALKREEVDRVPTFEWLIDSKVINSILPGSTEEEFIYKMDIDGIVVYPDYKKEEIEPGVFRDEWGNTIKYSKETIPISEGCIKTLEDLKKYQPPDPVAPHRLDTIRKSLKLHAGRKAVIIHLNDVFSIPRNLLGYEDLFINIANNPKLIEVLVSLSVDYNLAVAKEAVKLGIKIVGIADDYAYDKGLLISPKSFNEIFYPGFLKVMRGYKEMGLLVIKHSDGNIWPIIDKFVDAGIDCIDPIEPTAGMSIKDVKEKYGNQVAIKGNVDCAYTLTFGKKDDVIAETLQCLKDGAPGYGFILSSSNSIHSGVKPENYVAMLETLKEYGRYPLKF